jgi:hypothetical protein
MGAPKGNRNGAKAAEWTAALKWNLENIEVPERGIARGMALREIAAGVVRKALEGDPAAWQEIANRLDGKPAQAVQVTGDEDSPLMFGIVKLVRPD